MYSLFYVTANQHGEELAPVRCNKQTITRLIRYFEDVVIENRLSALVVEGRCLDGDAPREGERLGKLAAVARYLYLFTCDRSCPSRSWRIGKALNLTHIEEREHHRIETGPFVLVMDARFCGLLASYALVDRADRSKVNYEMVWTFDPNVVFTAIEYLMARLNVQKKEERQRFEVLLKVCTPHTSSLRLALSVTTKLTMLMQRQTEREMAINSISSAISSTLDLDRILQAAVDEVGRALKARRAALVLWREGTSRPESMTVFEREDDPPPLTASSDLVWHQAAAELESTESSNGSRSGPLGAPCEQGSLSVKLPTGLAATTPCQPGPRASYRAEYSEGIPGQLEFPVTYRDRPIGVLVVEDDSPGRVWEDEEMLMVRTVSDQLAVAISHARLFRQVQTEALTDPLTGLYNHRHFQDRLGRDIRLAGRSGEKVSLILLDLDYLKRINDTWGHRAGDECLRHVGRTMLSAVREIGICARYGGEEFAIVLPKCDRENALNVAERVREAIASTPVDKVGYISASIGVATYPGVAGSREELIEMADRAMYLAKAAGRNCVRTLPGDASGGTADASGQSLLDIG